MSLIVLLLLPFIGSCLAALLPHNARNSESLLAGLVALPDPVRAEILERVRMPSRVDGPIGEAGGTWV